MKFSMHILSWFIKYSQEMFIIYYYYYYYEKQGTPKFIQEPVTYQPLELLQCDADLPAISSASVHFPALQLLACHSQDPNDEEPASMPRH